MTLYPVRRARFPRAVLSGEGVAAVRLGEGLARVEHHAERVRLQQDIGHDDPPRELEVFTRVPRVLMVAQIKPRPSTKWRGRSSEDLWASVFRELITSLSNGRSHL